MFREEIQARLIGENIIIEILQSADFTVAVQIKKHNFHLFIHSSIFVEESLPRYKGGRLSSSPKYGFVLLWACTFVLPQDSTAAPHLSAPCVLSKQTLPPMSKHANNNLLELIPCMKQLISTDDYLMDVCVFMWGVCRKTRWCFCIKF